jgi:hypothetical protein
MIIKNALKGIAIALVAAYFFGIVFGLLYGSRSLFDSVFGSFILIPIVGVIYTFWFVIPIGAIFGILIPKIARHHSRKVTIIYGLLIGIVVGIAGTFALWVIGFQDGFRESHSRDVIIFLSVMSLYSSIWTIAYAYLSSKKFF